MLVAGRDVPRKAEGVPGSLGVPVLYLVVDPITTRFSPDNTEARAPRDGRDKAALLFFLCFVFKLLFPIMASQA